MVDGTDDDVAVAVDGVATTRLETSSSDVVAVVVVVSSVAGQSANDSAANELVDVDSVSDFGSALRVLVRDDVTVATMAAVPAE